MTKKSNKNKKSTSKKNISIKEELVITEKVVPKKKKNKREIISKMKIENAVFLPGREIDLPVDVVLPKAWAKLLTTNKS